VPSEYSSEAVLPVEGVLVENPSKEASDAAEAARLEAARLEIARRDAATARALRFFALVSVAVIAVDQLSKAWIRSWLSLHTEHEIIPGWLSFSHILNHGAAWGMLSGQRWFLIAVTLFVMFIVGQMARELAPHSKMARAGLGLILGGAIGNLIDRIWMGAVTDFIDLQTSIEWIRTFPIFNVADSALTVGVIILLIDFLWNRREISSSVGKKAPVNSDVNSEIS
jgi:signal peptidase II